MVTGVESDQKAPFSIATSPNSYSIPWIAPLYPRYVPYITVKQEGIKYHFKSLWYNVTWDWTPVSRVIREHSTHWVKLKSNIINIVWQVNKLCVLVEECVLNISTKNSLLDIWWFVYKYNWILLLKNQ